MEKAKPWRVPGAPGTGHARLAWIMLVLALALAGCARSDPEQRLRQDFSSLQAALDERRPRDFMEGISDDFAGNEGLDRAALHNLVRAQLLARSHTNVDTGPLQVSLHGDTATVRFTAVVSGGSGRFAVDSARVYEVTTGWRDDDGTWRMYYAQWTPKLG